MEQSRPITFGRQWHWPPNASQASLSAPTSWQAHGTAPLLKKADRDTAELRQNGEALGKLQGGRGERKRGSVAPGRGTSTCCRSAETLTRCGSCFGRSCWWSRTICPEAPHSSSWSCSWTRARPARSPAGNTACEEAAATRDSDWPLQLKMSN